MTEKSKKAKEAKPEKVRIKEIREAFTTFDRDKSGTLTADELVGILCHPQGGKAFTVDEAKALIGKFDTNDDGELDIHEVSR